MSTQELSPWGRALLFWGSSIGAALISIETIGMLGEQLATKGLDSPTATISFRTLIGALVMFLWLAPMVYFAGLFTRRLAASTMQLPIRIALGLGIGFTFTHLLAWLGAFSPSARDPTMLLWCAASLFTVLALCRWLIASWRSKKLRDFFLGVPGHYFIATPVIAIMFMAASQPPGWLWASEFGGFDSLSYHLQLPQEWLTAGRLAPVDHNVYSYLPSYVEAVFMQFGTGADALNSVTVKSNQVGLLTFDGLPLFVCQHFHAWCAIIAAWLTGRVVALLTGAKEASGFTFAAMLAVPWVVVTGSLSYNDCAVLALFAGAMLVAADSAIPASVRGAVAAFLIGVACGCKPTALLFCAAPVGLMLLRDVPMHRLAKVAIVALPVGVLTLAPWLIRNYLTAHNPVFPQLSSIFGNSHWDFAQFSRYSSAHSFTGSIVDRFSLLFSSDRGLMHFQFAGVGAVLALLIPLVVMKATRKVSVLLTLGIATQLVAWMFATHLQSRFLLPMLVPLLITLGLFFHALRARKIALIALISAVFAQGMLCFVLYAREHTVPGRSGGMPNFLLFVGPGYFTGDAFRNELSHMREPERSRIINENLGPEAYLHLNGIDPTRLLLIGDATPLYFGPVAYSTTWDKSPLLTPAAAPELDRYKTVAELRTQGFSHLLVNFGELDRYQKSNWNHPLMSPAGLTPWLRENAIVIKEWPTRATVLFELQRPAAARRYLR